MSIRNISFVVSFVAIAAMGTVANAQSFVTPPTSYTVSDSYLNVQQSQNLDCHIDGFGVSITSSTTASVNVDGPNTLLGFDWLSLCPLVSLNKSDWIVTLTGPVSGGVVPVTISNISAKPLLGGLCAGSVTGSFDNATDVLTIPAQNIGSSTCTISGDVKIAGLSVI